MGLMFRRLQSSVGFTIQSLGALSDVLEHDSAGYHARYDCYHNRQNLPTFRTKNQDWCAESPCCEDPESMILKQAASEKS